MGPGDVAWERTEKLELDFRLLTLSGGMEETKVNG